MIDCFLFSAFLQNFWSHGKMFTLYFVTVITDFGNEFSLLWRPWKPLRSSVSHICCKVLLFSYLDLPVGKHERLLLIGLFLLWRTLPEGWVGFLVSGLLAR